MKIEVMWVPTTSEQSAVNLVGQISQEIGLPLLPAILNRRHEALVFEIPGLTDIVKLKHGDYEYCVAIAHVHGSLLVSGIHAEICVDGFTILQYAAQQEKKVRLLDEARNVAIQALLKMRSWLKSRELADIRRGLANALNR